MYRYKQRMGGCKRLVDKASKALSIFHERRDTVKQYIAGEYRAVHTLREGLERGEVHSSVALWWVLCEDTVWNYITSTHLHFVLKGQTRRTCSENASERWTGLDTHIHIYVCVYIYILQLFVYNSYTHTFIYIYIYCNCDTILCQCFKPSENKTHSSLWSLCTPSPIIRGIFIPRSLRRFIY